jgi:DNA-binding transcriptional ArsR family regulator
MSIEALRWALDKGMEAELEPTMRYVLLILGNRADEQGYLYPSITWIEQRTGLSRRTVQRHLQALEEKGLLTRQLREKDGGQRTSDALQLPLDQPGLFQTKGGDMVTPPRATVTPRGCHGDTQGGDMVSPYTQEVKHKSSKTKASAFALPDWVPTENWKHFEEMRRKLKKAMTDRAKQMIVNALDKLRAEGENIAAVLDQSTLKCWTDVYPVKKDAMRPAAGNGYASLSDTDNQLEAKAKSAGVSTIGLSRHVIIGKINEKMGLH